MSQRITTCNCCEPQSTPKVQKEKEFDGLQFHVKDSIKLVYKFTNYTFNPPILIPLTEFDFTVNFFVEGQEDIKYTCSKIGLITTNCVLDHANSSIRCILDGQDNTGLPSGDLWAEYIIEYYDPEFPDRKAQTYDKKSLNIRLYE